MTNVAEIKRTSGGDLSPKEYFVMLLQSVVCKFFLDLVIGFLLLSVMHVVASLLCRFGGETIGLIQQNVTRTTSILGLAFLVAIVSTAFYRFFGTSSVRTKKHGDQTRKAE